MYRIYIKSGTSGHYDRDNCDLIVAEIPSSNIPRVGDFIDLKQEKGGYQSYLVREVKRSLHPATKDHDFREYIDVYVVIV